MSLEQYFKERISENNDSNVFILYSDPKNNVKLVSTIP